MSTEPKTTLSILFAPPERKGSPALHEREVDNVPISVAEQIAEDFVRQGRESEVGRYQMYRIGDGENERLLALDFGEVLAVHTQQ